MVAKCGIFCRMTSFPCAFGKIKHPAVGPKTDIEAIDRSDPMPWRRGDSFADPNLMDKGTTAWMHAVESQAISSSVGPKRWSAGMLTEFRSHTVRDPCYSPKTAQPINRPTSPVRLNSGSGAIMQTYRVANKTAINHDVSYAAFAYSQCLQWRSTLSNR